MDHGAKVAHVDTIEQATAALRAGRGADLLMVDARLDIAALIAANEAEHIVVPVVAAGVGIDPDAGRQSHPRRAPRNIISLPPEPELIAAVLAAISDDERPLIAEDAVDEASDRARRSDRRARTPRS